MAKAYLNLAGVLFEEGDYEAAAKNYQEALRVQPTHTLAYCNLGITFKTMGRYTDALNSFEQALALQLDDAISHHHILTLRTDLPG